jgi:hypothetical protein
MAQFDAMPTRAKVQWLDRFANRTVLSPDDRQRLRDELPALARSVGIGWSWRTPRPLRLRDVDAVHVAIRDGMEVLKASSRVPRMTAAQIRAQLETGIAGPPPGWALPPHRTTLRLLPQPAEGEKTTMLAVFEADDDVSSIVAAVGYFLWQHAPVWRECACGCRLTFIANGKQKFIDTSHQARMWQREYYATPKRRRWLASRRPA